MKHSKKTKDDAIVIESPDREDRFVSLVRDLQASDERWRWQGNGTKRYRTPRLSVTPEGEKERVISFHQYTGIVDYRPRDLIVTVRAGTTYAELLEVLQKDRMTVAIAPPYAAYATVGGLYMSGEVNWFKMGQGSWRDHVLATRILMTSGEVMELGSKVMKNVAGYDFVRLLIGSLGSLAGALEITFRLRPLPPRKEAVVLPLETLDWIKLTNFFRVLRDTPQEMQGLYVLNKTTAASIGWPDVPALLAIFADEPAAVAIASSQWMALAKDVGLVMRRHINWQGVRDVWQEDGFRLSEDALDQVFDRLARILPAHTETSNDPHAHYVRSGVHPTAFPELWQRTEAMFRDRNPFMFGCYGSGILHTVLPQKALDDLALSEALRSLREPLSTLPSFLRHDVRLESTPSLLFKGIDRYPVNPGERKMMQTIKKVFDPKHSLPSYGLDENACGGC